MVFGQWEGGNRAEDVTWSNAGLRCVFGSRLSAGMRRSVKVNSESEGAVAYATRRWASLRVAWGTGWRWSGGRGKMDTSRARCIAGCWIVGRDEELRMRHGSAPGLARRSDVFRTMRQALHGCAVDVGSAGEMVGDVESVSLSATCWTRTPGRGRSGAELAQWHFINRSRRSIWQLPLPCCEQRELICV